MFRRVLAALVLCSSTADAQELTDEEALRLAEEQEAETIVVFDERPEKPFDRDTELRLTGEELAARGATDLGTALALLPDVSVRDVGRGGFNIDIRGARKGAVRVVIDGVAVSDPFYGTFDVSTIPITDIEEIRVSTAPISPIDGPGGPGGMIEVHTRDAIGEKLVVGRLTTDTLPRFGASATGRVALAEDLALRLSASSTFGAEQFDLPGDASITDKRRASTFAMRLEERRGRRRLVLDGFADDRRYVSPPSDELATALILLVDRETSGRIGVGIDKDIGADRKLQLQARGWLHAMTRLSRNFRDPGLTEQANREDLFSMRTGAMALLTRPIGRLARWVASTTVDHERASVDTTVFTGDDASSTPARGDVTIVEVAGGAQLEKGPVKVDGAVGVAVPAGIDADPWPEAKLSVTYARRWGKAEVIGALKGRVPSLRERFQGTGANESLDPEQMRSAEARLTATPHDGIEIVLAPYLRRTTGTVKVGEDNLLMNLGRLDTRGFEISARATIVDQVTVGGAYVYAWAYAQDLPPPMDEHPLDRYPRRRAEGWVQVRPIEAVSLLARVRDTGRAWDRGVETPAYVTWEASATVQRGDWLGALRVDDVLDVAPETRNGFRQPGRVVSLVLQRTWR
jgi:hypothetical protein